MSITKTTDDLDAVRAVIEAIKDFKPDEQQRIFRWASEKLGLPQPFGTGSVAAGPSPVPSPVHPSAHTPPAPAAAGTTKDIKSFVAAKNPRSDIQFVKTVAYYFRFEAPQPERKDSIDKEDLQEACRKVGRERLKNPYQTLMNAHNLGLLDKGPEKATFAINSIGENLVAMTLPSDGNPNARTRAKKSVAKAAAKKAPAKKVRRRER